MRNTMDVAQIQLSDGCRHYIANDYVIVSKYD